MIALVTILEWTFRIIVFGIMLWILSWVWVGFVVAIVQMGSG